MTGPIEPDHIVAERVAAAGGDVDLAMEEQREDRYRQPFVSPFCWQLHYRVDGVERVELIVDKAEADQRAQTVNRDRRNHAIRLIRRPTVEYGHELLRRALPSYSVTGDTVIVDLTMLLEALISGGWEAPGV